MRTMRPTTPQPAADYAAAVHDYAEAFPSLFQGYGPDDRPHFRHTPRATGI